MEELEKKSNDYHIYHGLQVGFGSFLLMLAFMLWKEDFFWLFPYAISASMLIGVSSGNNLRLQKKGLRDIPPKDNEKTK